MLLTIFSCLALIAATTLIHYESLQALHLNLRGFNIPARSKLLVAVLIIMAIHFIEITVYGLGYFILIEYFEIGNLVGGEGFSLRHCIYFSAETYTSLGFGDVLPTGHIRLLAGIEALNGLLLIGWSASFLYISMEKFWTANNKSAS